MIYTFCTKTDPGRARDNNEDAASFDEATRLGVLADGMGGYNAGEIASGMATAFMRSPPGASSRHCSPISGGHHWRRLPPARFDVVTLDGAGPQWLQAAFDAG